MHHRIYLSAMFLVLLSFAGCKRNHTPSASNDVATFAQFEYEIQDPYQVVKSYLIQQRDNPEVDDRFPFARKPEFDLDYDRLTRGEMDILVFATISGSNLDAQLQHENLKSLHRFLAISWPRVVDLDWIEVDRTKTHGRTIAGWLVYEDHEVMYVMDGLFDTHLVKRSTMPTVRFQSPRESVTRYGEHVERILAYFKERESKPNQYARDHKLGLLSSRVGPSQLLLNLAVMSAQCGLQRETSTLLAYMFRDSRFSLSSLQDAFVWDTHQRAMSKLVSRRWSTSVTSDVDAWNVFLCNCKELREAFPDGRYADRLASYIHSIETELSRPIPEFLNNPIESFTQEETIRYLIFKLRDYAPSPFPFSSSQSEYRRSPIGLLEAIGIPAIPFLIETLLDDTPTRKIDSQRFPGDSGVLRSRRGYALGCLMELTGCCSYRRSDFDSLASESNEYWTTLHDQINSWWNSCGNQPQVQMIDCLLRSLEKLRPVENDQQEYDRNRRLITTTVLLARLVGPDVALGRLRQVPDWNLCSERERRELFGTPGETQQAFANLDNNIVLYGDLEPLLRYGGRHTYERLTQILYVDQNHDHLAHPIYVQSEPSNERFLSSRAFAREDIRLAATHGQNWGIPLLFVLLNDTHVRGWTGDREFSNSDLAMDEIISLIDVDFGYDPLADRDQRRRVVQDARDWWEQEGNTQFATMVNRDHPPRDAYGDQFFSSQSIERKVAAITSPNDGIRRTAISQLEYIQSIPLQRALLNALTLESIPRERLEIMSLLAKYPKPWHFPVLTRHFEHDESLQCRIAAGQIIRNILRKKSYSGWSTYLETREDALHIARRIATDNDEPIELRIVAFEGLLCWNAMVDHLLIEQMKIDFEPWMER